MKKTCVFSFFICLLFNCNFVLAQGSAGSRALYESRQIVDMPTAGVIPKGSYSTFAVSTPGGGLSLEASFALFENFNAGISYGGYNIIGEGSMAFQGLPGGHIKYRFFDETLKMPAISAGIDVQGTGNFLESHGRFQTLSPGVFVAASKNYIWSLGEVSFHGGVNYSFEARPEDRAPNFFGGFEHSIGNAAAICVEYNSNTDDGIRQILKNKGMLSAALRLSPVSGFTVELQARDILQNYAGAQGFKRNIAIEYIGRF